MAHGAGHAGLREVDPHLLLGFGVAVEQPVSEDHLLHEEIMECLQGGSVMRILVRRGLLDDAKNPETHADGAAGGQQITLAHCLHDLLLLAQLPVQSRSAMRGVRIWLPLSPVPESCWATANTSLRHILYSSLAYPSA